jgi:hypothetical protein
MPLSVLQSWQIIPGEIYVNRSFLPDPVMLSLIVTSVWLLVAYLQTERLHYLLLASLAGCWDSN